MKAHGKIPALTIGKKGESEVEQYTFDISEWQEAYGDGTPVLLIQRPGDAVIYPASLQMDGAMATWTVSSTDTAKPGIGKGTLQYTVGEKVKKSNMFWIVVQDVLAAQGAIPAPYSDYAEQAVENARAAAQSAQEAAQSAEEASHYRARLVDGAILF